VIATFLRRAAAELSRLLAPYRVAIYDRKGRIIAIRSAADRREVSEWVDLNRPLSGCRYRVVQLNLLGGITFDKWGTYP